MTQELINSGVQLAAVLIISLIVYLIFGRKSGSFRRYVGLIAPTGRSLVWAIAAALVLAPFTLALFYFTPLHELAASDGTIAAKIRDLGLQPSTFAIIAVIAFVKTGLSEEIFFRGLIAKRLVNAFGFWPGNIVQAALFASVHLLLFLAPGAPAFAWGLAGPLLAILIVSSMIKLYMNERVGGGSIVPSWLIHGTGNALAYPVLAFA